MGSSERRDTILNSTERAGSHAAPFDKRKVPHTDADVSLRRASVSNVVNLFVRCCHQNELVNERKHR